MSQSMVENSLPLPPFYNPEKVAEIYRVPYQQRADDAQAWKRRFGIKPSTNDDRKISLLLVDVQNTFCIPGFELFVGGASGLGAVEDNRRLCEFIYRNLGSLTNIICTLDTHRAAQIFHPAFLVGPDGSHPAPLTLISNQDIVSGRWRFNAALSASLGIDPSAAQAHLLHYTAELDRLHKYALTIWPYHAMLGGIGHALVSAVEEAVFFHTIARQSQAQFEIKGEYATTENYSVIGPEVRTDPDGQVIAEVNPRFLTLLKEVDMLIIAGQAKSHCVAWTVADLLEMVNANDPSLVDKIYLLEDCSSPVVVPGIVDYSAEANAAYKRFASAGVHLIRSSHRL